MRTEAYGEDMKALTPEAVSKLMKKLLSWEALELQETPGRDLLLIPYVMNDAVECYLRLEKGRVQGTLNQDCLPETQIEIVDDGIRTGIILRQIEPDEREEEDSTAPEQATNVVTIWYRNAVLAAECFQYHMIGHSWRRRAGEEALRRLVNLVCVLHDKMTYLGEEFCSGQEIRIAKLAQFPPFLMLTPINEPILDWYSADRDGILAMQKLAEEAGDDELVLKLEQYLELYDQEKLKSRHVKQMNRRLLERSHAKCWILLEQWIDHASEDLHQRNYDPEAEQMIGRHRQAVVQKYEQMGFQGSYPVLMRQNPAGGETEVIRFAEEQPFTVLEEPDFRYKIFSMRRTGDNMRESVWTLEDEWKHITIID